MLLEDLRAIGHGIRHHLGFEEVPEVVSVVVVVIERHAIVLIDREVLSRIHISEHQGMVSTSACGRLDRRVR